eukprot:g36983.t1
MLPLYVRRLYKQSYVVPVVRVSYHGKNHYNSLVSATLPFRPLGDGKDSPISFEQVRISQERKEKSSPSPLRQLQLESSASFQRLRQSPRHHLQQGAALSRETQRSLINLLKDTEPEINKVVSAQDLDEMWRECDPRDEDELLREYDPRDLDELWRECDLRAAPPSAVSTRSNTGAPAQWPYGVKL